MSIINSVLYNINNAVTIQGFIKASPITIRLFYYFEDIIIFASDIQRKLIHARNFQFFKQRKHASKRDIVIQLYFRNDIAPSICSIPGNRNLISINGKRQAFRDNLIQVNIKIYRIKFDIILDSLFIVLFNRNL